MSLIRSGLEFGVVLNTDEKRTVGKLDSLNKSAVGGLAGKDKTVFGEYIAIIVVEFITVTVSFGNFIRAVATLHGCALGNYAGICAETECAALVNVFTLTGHEVNNLIFAYFIKFARMCV